ncbi:MAG TPA: SDR family oxidoreductase [Dehalococcoidia bacterium]|nr:SDR family oxidoreductase [Dehalococcoidia bacterium]
MTENNEARERWALILGSSSGFGGTTAIELAQHGYHIFGVHFDRRTTLPIAMETKARIEAAGVEAVFYNVNAADAEKRAATVQAMADHLAGRSGRPFIQVVLHSLAFGTLKPMIAEAAADELTQAQIEMTLDVMANSLVYWTQALCRAGLLDRGSRIFAMTSSGGTRVIKNYGAVSAAKAALEAHIRQLAVELAPCGITANAVRAGVTDTAALRKIPGSDRLLENAATFNPHGRTTTPEDVAKAIAELARPGTYWITGNTIGVDGGEDVVAAS